MKTSKLEKKVIEEINKLDPSKYWRRLWDERLIGPQGPSTLEHLVSNAFITEEAMEFAKKHFENDDSDVDDTLRHSFYTEVVHHWANLALKEAEAGNEDYDYLMEIEDKDERFNAAFETESDDHNYYALQNYLASVYDTVILAENN